jgi:arylsulfatase A
MTGRTPYRVGIYNAIPFLSPTHLRASEITIASLLRRGGYATAQVGKWHLNGFFNLLGQPQPGDHGFEHWFAAQNNALPNHLNPFNFVRNGVPLGPQPGYSGAIVAAEAVRWLESGRDRTKPFFLYVALHEPHEPIMTDPAFADRYRARHPDDPSRVAYYGNVTQLDAAVGRILAALESPPTRSCGSPPITAPRARVTTTSARQADSGNSKAISTRAASACRASCAGHGASSPAP